jgi:hypothetical protein
MKLHKILLYVNAIVLFVFVLWGGISAGSAGIGIAISILGLLNIPELLIFLIAKDWVAVKTCMLFIGVFLLVDFSICSMPGFHLS